LQNARWLAFLEARRLIALEPAGANGSGRR
jgi:hypothetical protein